MAMDSVSKALGEVSAFVNRTLGTTITPTVEVEKEPTAEYVAIRIPKTEEIIAHPKFLPTEESGQKTVLLHEASEIAFERKGIAEPHLAAEEFTEIHWRDIGGKSPEAVHKELEEKGYYHSSTLDETLAGELGVRSEQGSLNSLVHTMAVARQTREEKVLATLLLLITEEYADASCRCEEKGAAYSEDSEEARACFADVGAIQRQLHDFYLELVKNLKGEFYGKD